MTPAFIEQCERLRKLAEAATPGPWTAMHKPPKSYDDHGYRIVAGPSSGSRKGVYALRDNMVQEGRGCVWGEDAEFIAAANPAFILQLMDAVLAMPIKPPRDAIVFALGVLDARLEENDGTHPEFDRASNYSDELHQYLERTAHQAKRNQEMEPICPACNGSGGESLDDTCGMCEGSGMLRPSHQRDEAAVQEGWR